MTPEQAQALLTSYQTGKLKRVLNEIQLPDGYCLEVKVAEKDLSDLASSTTEGSHNREDVHPKTLMHTPDVASDRKGGLSGTVTSAVPKAIHGIPTSIDVLQNVPKPIHSAPMSVQAVTRQKLPFRVHYIVGLGYDGELILADWVSERYLYKMQHNGEGYKEVWKKESPAGMKFDCDKQLSIDGHIFLQGDIDKTIVCYDESLRKKN